MDALWNASREHMACSDVARLLPSDAERYPAWWPAGRRTIWRVAVRAFTSSGEVGSICGVSTGERLVLHEGTPEEVVIPRMVWPRASGEAAPYEVSDLMFACASAQAMLAGEPSPLVQSVVFVEGVLDFMRMAEAASFHPCAACDARSNMGSIAVFGAVSARVRPINLARARVLAQEAPLTFYAAVEADSTGRRLLLDLVEALHPAPVHRLPLERWAGVVQSARPSLSKVLDAGVHLAELLAAAVVTDPDDLRALVASDLQARR
jgi:hypothetical protein